MNPNEIRNLPTESSLNNVIDEDLQAMLRPLGLFQAIFVMAKFNIKSNFITPKNKTYYMKSAFAAIILIIINFYGFSVSAAVDIYTSTSIIVVIIMWFDCLYYSIVVIIIYINSAMQSSNTVLLIIKLQQALRTINIKSNMMSHMKIWNWIHILSIFGLYVVYAIDTCRIYNDFNVSFLFLIVAVLSFDLNVIYASRTVTFTCNVLALWNRKMLNQENNYYQENQENQLDGKAMLNAYFDIIKSFRLTERIYQFAITYHIVEIFVHSLFTVQISLEFSKDRKPHHLLYDPLTTILYALWFVKNVLLLISLSFACEKFYRNIEDTETLCARILQLEESDLRKTCKNVVRINHASFRKLRACGLFAVDAALPVRLLAAVLAYTVVLLQFAFL